MGEATQVAIEEQMATVWTLQSEARVGSYQHEVSLAPWMVLHAEQDALRAHLMQERP